MYTLSSCSTSPVTNFHSIHKIHFLGAHLSGSRCTYLHFKKSFSIKCSSDVTKTLRTCKNCKTQFDPSLNNPLACSFHTAHFGGETKRKFESVYEGGTMSTPNGGQVIQYWHCCGSEDPFDPGCTSAPHSSYDD